MSAARKISAQEDRGFIQASFAMSDAEIDAEVARRYAAGESSSEIAQALGLGMIDIVGRIRRLGIQPPGMGARRVRTTEGDSGGTVHPFAPVSTRTVEPALPNPPVAMPVADSTEAAVRTVRPEARRPAAKSTRSTTVAVEVERKRPRLVEAVAEAASLSDDDDDDMVVRAGCPRGWLISEREFDVLFDPKFGRFEDHVPPKPKPKTYKPLPSLMGQDSRTTRPSTPTGA
ncbi:hypothetical protein [Arenibaculum pallidiluteum]|uniref:hypothetical protein n=1 Tax=Arenibaculum pallidiluteum TaxID=2812559 RepID=UPI001A9691BB|nr:hypothetical protein [Arenibaculum pallidiluteum]